MRLYNDYKNKMVELARRINSKKYSKKYSKNPIWLYR